MLLLLIGAALVVAGVALWSVAAALVCAGLLAMVGAVALAAVQDAARPVEPAGSSNGMTSQHEAPVG